MTSPISMLAQIGTRNNSEESTLRTVANGNCSVEFFELTNMGCFPHIDFYGQSALPLEAVDAALDGYGISYSPWTQGDLPSEKSDPKGSKRQKVSNGVVHFGIYVPESNFDL